MELLQAPAFKRGVHDFLVVNLEVGMFAMVNTGETHGAASK